MLSQESRDQRNLGNKLEAGWYSERELSLSCLTCLQSFQCLILGSKIYCQL